MTAFGRIRPGYKQTEAGVIPDDWSEITLGDVTLKVGSGITPKGGSRVYGLSGRAFVRSQNVGWGTLLLDDLAFIDDDTHDSFSSTELKTGDVLLNITGASIGRSAVADVRVEAGNVNQHVCIIRTLNSQLFPDFLNYFLLSENGQKQIDSFQAGGNRQGLNFGQIKSFKIAVSQNIDEQRAIAAALGDADALIAALDVLIAKKRCLKQAAMQQLLTGKTRLPGFKGEWQVKRLGDICLQITDGTHFTPTYVNQGKPFYSVENVTADNFSDTKFISVSDHEEMIRRCKPEKGDILLTRIGSLGVTRLIDWDVDASIYVSLALLKLSKLVDPVYFYMFTKSSEFVRAIEQRALINAAPKKINMGEIADVPVLLPSLDEQISLGIFLQDMSSELAALEARRDKARAIKQGMMQELLTGRIRLSIQDNLS